MRDFRFLRTRKSSLKRLVQRAEVPAPTQGQQMLNKACTAELGAHVRVDPDCNGFVWQEEMKKMKDVEMPYNELLKICQSTNIQMTNQQIYHEQKDTIAKSSGQTFLSIGQAGLVPHRKKKLQHTQTKHCHHSHWYKGFFTLNCTK